MEQKWQIGGLIETWKESPAEGPQVLVGVYGPVNHRFIVGAARIDADRWNQAALHVSGDRWRLPLTPGTSLDECELRGRRVVGVRFGRLAHLLHIWVNAQGAVLHPPSGRNADGLRSKADHDEWGDLAAVADGAAREAHLRLDEEERKAGHEPW